MDQGVADDLGVPAAVLAALNGIDLVGAPTSNAEDEWAVARRGAIRVARTAGARLILADVSTRSLFVTPYGSGSTTADTGDSYSAGDRAVDRQGLERLGRHYLVEQLGEAATAGVNAEVWLATKPGAGSLVMFLERFPIDALVTPPLDDPSLHQRMRRHQSARLGPRGKRCRQQLGRKRHAGRLQRSSQG